MQGSRGGLHDSTKTAGKGQGVHFSEQIWLINDPKRTFQDPFQPPVVTENAHPVPTGTVSKGLEDNVLGGIVRL